MKILKPGKVEQRRFVCPDCGCVFVLSVNDIWGEYVVCPQEGCGYDFPSKGDPYEEPVQDDMERLASLVRDAPQKRVNSWEEAAELIAKCLIDNGVTFRR